MTERTVRQAAGARHPPRSRPSCVQPSRFGVERGAGTVLVAAALMAVLVAWWVAVVLASWVDGVHDARAAADLSALSAAQAQVTGSPACAAAERIARSNNGVLESCDVEGDAQAFVVRVRVSVPLRPALSGTQRVSARAVAGPSGA